VQPLNQSQETHTAKFGKNTSTNINREKVRSKLKNIKEQKKRLSDLKTKKNFLLKGMACHVVKNKFMNILILKISFCSVCQ